ncbi:averantin oxidoreductase [Colletotrichum tamarilloi]|uniref:Averantin oxidoreductase n=1 Tax=Colletotrichum tamarilloi TaxID=1209934 RepID=A0ABQ9QHH8_9PEZI|nr:averantin oxidoreductase [Colletotrichum tamarilloi]KAK1470428.1 averantin oxidoreductase [Colletotrichum tamarilloi]
MAVQNQVDNSIELSLLHHVGMFMGFMIALIMTYQLCLIFYNLFFHPLAKYPGPRLAAATPLWVIWSYYKGKTPWDLLDLHNKYGPVVRTTPDGLSFINASQWKEIYGHKPSGELEFSKDPKYHAGWKGEPVILNADRHYHGYIRKLFAHGFSEKALREQEPILQEYVDLLFHRLDSISQSEQPIDLVQWFNYFTFDFIGYLMPDFMEKMIAAHESGKMSYHQLEENSQILIGAGSETTATLLSGLVWLLLKHPRVYDKLATEIRTMFERPEDITMISVNECRYLLACIEETLRIYPPSPQPHPRIIPPGGATVDNEFLPEGTFVSIPIYAASNSPMNWTNPEEFAPERWIGEDARFDNDKRDASQPFQYGPRNCIGRNLAYVEMKIIMSRLLWHFDVMNATDYNWMDQRVFAVWEKSPLWVRLCPAKRT